MAEFYELPLGYAATEDAQAVEAVPTTIRQPCSALQLVQYDERHIGAAQLRLSAKGRDWSLELRSGDRLPLPRGLRGVPFELEAWPAGGGQSPILGSHVALAQRRVAVAAIEREDFRDAPRLQPAAFESWIQPTAVSAKLAASNAEALVVPARGARWALVDNLPAYTDSVKVAVVAIQARVGGEWITAGATRLANYTPVSQVIKVSANVAFAALPGTQDAVRVVLVSSEDDPAGFTAVGDLRLQLGYKDRDNPVCRSHAAISAPAIYASTAYLNNLSVQHGRVSRVVMWTNNVSGPGSLASYLVATACVGEEAEVVTSVLTSAGYTSGQNVRVAVDVGSHHAISLGNLNTLDALTAGYTGLAVLS